MQGAGYLDEEINQNLGVAQTSSADAGYESGDGSYTSLKQVKFQPLPIDTDNSFVNSINAQTNDLMAENMKSSSMRALEDLEVKGHGTEPYRDGMDNYMAFEFGRSKYDDGFTNAITSEDVRRNRANEQTMFAPLANGLGRCSSRIAGTVGSILAGVLDFTARGVFGLLGQKYEGDLVQFAADNEDAAINWWNEKIPVYQTADQERIAQEHPLDPSYLTSGASVATFIDNIGFTIGAMGGASLLAYLGPGALAGVATAVTGEAIMKVIDKEGYNNSKILPAALAAAGTVVGGVAGKVIKPFMRVQLGTIAAAEMSAVGEGAIEGVNAKKEFINEKLAFYDSMTNQRKVELKQQYDKAAAEAANKAYNEVKVSGGTEEEARAAMLAAQQEAMAGYENDLAIIDWQGTKAKNQAIGESESVRNLTALLNIPILTASNYIQWGKVLSGGFKTYRTMTNIEMRAGAKEAAQTAYKNAYNNAKDDAARAAVKAQKKEIENKAMIEWARVNGGNLFDTPKPNLTAKDYAEIFLKHPMAEGSEEINQAAAANFSKGYYEWQTDNYYSQVSDLDTYRKTENAWQAGMKGLVKTYFSESAWNEFLMGALTGLIGIPGWRGFKEKTMTVYDQEGKALPEPNVTEKKHYFPFVMRGGVYGEWKKMKQDKENAAKMADQLNKYISPENIERLRTTFLNLAKNAQYNKDKKVFVENGDKFNYQTAVDKELVNALELFQNSGNMGIFKTLVHSLYDVKTAEDMIALQEQTMTTDADGTKHGPYSEFHILELDENATDAQREANEEEMRKMREKIKENADHLVEAIDMYEKARYQLDWETRQGLTDSQLNCLTWYKVRLGLFDSRAKDMYGKAQSFIGDIMDNLDKIIETEQAGAEAGIAALEEELKNDKLSDAEKKEKREKIENIKVGLNLFKEGAGEFKRRYERARRESDPSKAVNILFAGNVKAKPVTEKGRLDFRLFGRSENKAKAFEEWRLQYNMDFFLQELLNGIENKEGYSTANALISSTILDDQDQLNENASYIRDMKQCVGRSLFYKDMYQSFKDNPTLMAKMEYQAQQDNAVKARREEVDKTTAEVRNGANSLSELYDTVVQMILDGKDVNLINETINKLAKEGNQAAKDFNVNQMFVRVFVNALDEVVFDVSEGAEAVYKAIIIQTVIDSSREVVGGEEILKLAQKKLNDIFKDKDSFIKYIKDNKLAADDEIADMFTDDVKVPVRDTKGNVIRNANKTPQTKSIGKSTTELLRNETPHIIAAAKAKVASKYRIYTAYSGGQHMTDEEIKAYNDRIAAATNSAEVDYTSQTIATQHALAQIGPDAENATTEETGSTTTSSIQQGTATTQQGGTATSTSSQTSTLSEEIKAAEREVGQWREKIDRLSEAITIEESFANDINLSKDRRDESIKKLNSLKKEIEEAKKKYAEAEKKLDDLRNKDTNGQGTTTEQQDGQPSGTSVDEDLAKTAEELEELKRQQEELERQRKAAEEAAKNNPPQGDNTDTDEDADTDTDSDVDTDEDEDVDENEDVDEEEEQPIEEEEEVNQIDERIIELNEEIENAETEEERQSLEDEKDALQTKSDALKNKIEEIKEQRKKERQARRERKEREKKQKAAEERDKKETPQEKAERLRKLQEDIQKKIDEKMEEMERLEAERKAAEAADALATPDSAVGDDENIESNKAVNDERERAELFKTQGKKNNVWRPVLSFFNLEFRKIGRYIRNCRVRFRRDGKKGMEECKEGEAGWCEAFWQTYEKLGIFKCLDEEEKDSPDAIRVGQEVFFLIDAVEVGKETSKYLGLTADECHYKGHPIIWMVVKRKDGSLQAVGSLATNDSKTYEYGQTPLRVEIEERFKAGGGRAYMHDRSSTINNIQLGYVASTTYNNNLANVYGSKYKARFTLNVQSEESQKKGEDAILIGDEAATKGKVHNPNGCVSGRLYCLIHDYSSGEDVHYGCRIARYGVDTEAQSTRKWIEADNTLRLMLNSFPQSLSLKEAKLKMNELYKQLNDLVNLSGFGVTLSVRQDRKTGQFYLVIGRQKKHADYLRDDKGNIKKTAKGSPLHERTETYIYLQGQAGQQTVEDFRKKLVGENGLPFKIYTQDLVDYAKGEKGGAGRDRIADLIEDGLITVNIESGMIHTLGAHVEVSTELNETSEARREREKREAATYAEEETDNVYSKEILGHKIEIDNSNHEVLVGGKKVTNERTKRLLKSIVYDEVSYEYFEDKSGLFHSRIFVKSNDEDKVEVLFCDKDGFLESSNSYDEIPCFEGNEGFALLVEYQKKASDFLYDYFDLLKDDFTQILSEAEKRGITRFSSPADFVISSLTEIAEAANKLRGDFEAEYAAFFISYLDSRFMEKEYKPKDYIWGMYSPLLYVCDLFYKNKHPRNPESVGYELYDAREGHGTPLYVNTKSGELVHESVVVFFEKWEKLYSQNYREDDQSTPPTQEEQQQPTAPAATEEQQPTTLPQQGEEERQPDPTVDPEQGSEQGSEGVRSKEEGIDYDQTGDSDLGAWDDNNDDFEKFSIRKPTDEKAAKMNKEKEMAAVRRIFPSMTHDECVEFVDDLIEVGSKGLVAQGVFKNGRMVVSMNAVRGTLFHEAFHKIYRTALTEQTQKDLLDDVRRVKDDYELNDFQAEEILCDWFRDYMVDQVYGKSWTQRIKDFFRRLFNLVRPGYEGLTSVTLRIFAEAQEGSYDRPRFEYKTVKQERIDEYKRLGLTYREMEILENARNAYDARTEEEKSMLAEAGITRKMFNILSPKSREEIIDCL